VTRDVPARVPSSAPTASLETVAAWKAIQKRMAPPTCRGHGLPCKVRTVKEGPNKGRGFFCCPKPKGMKGDKNADCGFFQWEKVYRK
jgi:AP endonuclease-2